MQIEGVPETVPLSEIKSFLERLGLDLHVIPKGKGGIVIGPQCIRASIFAHNDRGLHYLDRTTNEAALHEICIQIVDDTNTQNGSSHVPC
jgi:hypothetical protein